MRFELTKNVIITVVGGFLAGCSAAHGGADTGSTRAANDDAVLAGDVSGSEAKPADGASSGSRYEITLDELRKHVRGRTAVIIDARSHEAYSRGHVRGAVNVPAGDKQAFQDKMNKKFAKGQFIIIYCANPQCPAGDMVYDLAASNGFKNMRVFKPGWEKLSTETDLH